MDLLVPDDLWEKIKPIGKQPGAGLLCGACIMQRIEKLGKFGKMILEIDSHVLKNEGKHKA